MVFRFRIGQIALLAATISPQVEGLMKGIVLCADGTWNVRDQLDERTGKFRPTNVTKVARAIRPKTSHGVDQVAYYDEGIGTNGGLDKFTGGGFGHGIEDNVRQIYRFLLYNWEAGDEIYLFGFSRGAFTIRTVCGFMNRVGLLEKDDDYFVPEIWGCYEKAVAPGSPEWKHAFRHVRGTRACPPIRFVGVWDTVGALGAPGLIGQIFNRGKYKYHDIELHPCIQNAFQALAIDERRKPFKPSLWTRSPGWSGHLEQVWFAGVHSNVGGSYDPDGLANEALHWMVEKAEGLGLEFDGAYLRHFRPCFNSTLHDSMTLKYRAFGPHVRPSGTPGGEAIHQSALDRMNHAPSGYEPPNLRAYLNRHPGPSVTGTNRIPRGTPC